MCVLLKTNKQTATLVNFIEPLHMYFIFDLSALSTQNHAVTPATSKRYHGYLLWLPQDAFCSVWLTQGAFIISYGEQEESPTKT